MLHLLSPSFPPRSRRSGGKRGAGLAAGLLVLVSSVLAGPPADRTASVRGDEVDVATAYREAERAHVAGHRGFLAYRRLSYRRYLTPDVHFRWSAAGVINDNRRLAQPIATPVRLSPDILYVPIED